MNIEKNTNLNSNKIWSTHSYSRLKLHDTAKTLPFRLEPIASESLFSWLLRLARKNMTTIHILLKSHKIDLKRPQSIDNSWNLSVLNMITEKTNFTIERIKNLHTIKWNYLFPENLIKSQRVFSKRIKFCPLCLDKDADPFLRLEFKLNLINSCSIHHCILIDECPQCKSEFKPYRIETDKPIYYCYKCQYDFRKIEPLFILTEKSNLNAETQLLMLLELGTCSLIEQKNLNPPEFIEIIYKMVSYLMHAYSIGDPIFENKLDLDILNKQFNNDWNKLKSKFLFYQNSAIAYLIIDAAFSLLTDEIKLSKYIKAKQAEFNRITQFSCPDYLKKYRNLQKKSSLSKESISIVINELKQAKKPINYKSVAIEGGFDPSIFNYGTNEPLRQLIDDLNKETPHQYEEKVLKSIKELKENGIEASVKNVAKEVGLRSTYIYGEPKLARHFQIQRKINPTYILRIEAAINEIIGENKRLTKLEVAKRANISRNTLRKYPDLMLIIENALKNSRHPKFFEIKEKIDNLKKSGLVITGKMIEEATGVGLHVFYDHSELKELLDEATGTLFQKHKIRLFNALKSLKRQNKPVTIKALLREARIDYKTLLRNEKLHEFVKYELIKV
jgi:hypothetical protein